MKDKIADHVKGLIEQGRIAGFLGLKREGRHVKPHLFIKPEEMADFDLSGETRYSLIKQLQRMVRRYPGQRFGVLVRGDDLRSLGQLIEESTFHRDRVIPVGFSDGPAPYDLPADALVIDEPGPAGWPEGDEPQTRDETTLSLLARISEWLEICDTCLKCFGCRNVCPVCSCKECTIEDEQFIRQDELPASRNFLLTRALHMVDRCSDCGLCEEACPADIPLRELYRLVAEAVGREENLFPKAKQRPV